MKLCQKSHLDEFVGEMTCTWFAKLFYALTKTTGGSGWWSYFKIHTLMSLREKLHVHGFQNYFMHLLKQQVIVVDEVMSKVTPLWVCGRNDMYMVYLRV